MKKHISFLSLLSLALLATSCGGSPVSEPSASVPASEAISSAESGEGISSHESSAEEIVYDNTLTQDKIDAFDTVHLAVVGDLYYGSYIPEYAYGGGTDYHTATAYGDGVFSSTYWTIGEDAQGNDTEISETYSFYRGAQGELVAPATAPDLMNKVEDKVLEGQFDDAKFYNNWFSLLDISKFELAEEGYVHGPSIFDPVEEEEEPVPPEEPVLPFEEGDEGEEEPAEEPEVELPAALQGLEADAVYKLTEEALQDEATKEFLGVLYESASFAGADSFYGGYDFTSAHLFIRDGALVGFAGTTTQLNDAASQYYGTDVYTFTYFTLEFVSVGEEVIKAEDVKVKPYDVDKSLLAQYEKLNTALGALRQGNYTAQVTVDEHTTDETTGEPVTLNYHTDTTYATPSDIATIAVTRTFEGGEWKSTNEMYGNHVRTDGLVETYEGDLSSGVVGKNMVPELRHGFEAFQISYAAFTVDEEHSEEGVTAFKLREEFAQEYDLVDVLAQFSVDAVIEKAEDFVIYLSDEGDLSIEFEYPDEIDSEKVTLYVTIAFADVGATEFGFPQGFYTEKEMPIDYYTWYINGYQLAAYLNAYLGNYADIPFIIDTELGGKYYYTITFSNTSADYNFRVVFVDTVNGGLVHLEEGKAMLEGLGYEMAAHPQYSNDYTGLVTDGISVDVWTSSSSPYLFFDFLKITA